MDIFCQKHSNCEESITVIAKILSHDNPTKFGKICDEFQSLGFFKVKDLANATLGKASLVNLDGDPLAKLYEAIQIFDQHCATQLLNAKLEYQNGNYIKAKEICENLNILQPELDVLLLLAASYYKCEEYEKSKECYDQAYDINPNSPEVITGFGLYCLKTSQFEEATKCFLKSLRINFNQINHWRNYLSILLKYDTLDLETKISIFDIFFGRYPNLYVERNIYGQFLLFENYLKEARHQFKFAKVTAPEHSETWKNLGNAYLMLQKDEKAVFHYETALTLDQNSIITWNNLGLAYFNLSNYEKAIGALQASLKISPTDFTTLNLLADVYFEQKNMPLAIETYKKCLELKPYDSQVTSFLGFINYHLKDYEEAEKYFKLSMDIQPRDDVYDCLSRLYMVDGKYKDAAEVFISWGDMYFQENNFEKASGHYHVALRVDSDNAEAHWKMGVACYQMNLFDEALSRYRYAIDLKPNFSNVYCDCALLFEKKNQPQKAIEYYKMALQLNPDHENALYNMLILKQRLGHTEDVIVLLKRILEFDADDTDTFERCLELGDCLYKSMGNPIEALFYYRKALGIDSSYLDIYLAMGNIFIDLECSDDALKCFYGAIQIDPLCEIAHFNIGSIHKDNCNFKDAIESYQLSLNIKPDYLDAYCNLVECLKHICDWSNYDSHLKKLKEIVFNQLSNKQKPSLYPHHSLLYTFSPNTLKQIALRHGEQHLMKPYIVKSLSKKYVYPTSLSSNECIRVGFVSSNFGQHPIIQYMQSIPNIYNKNKFELFYYSLSSEDSSSFWVFEEDDDIHFKDIFKLNAIAAADEINTDGIHILVNLNGYAKSMWNEIFALRPAPIQVLWLGYPSTSSASFMDYLITDEVCSPPQFQHFFTEKLMYMNRSVFIGNHKHVFGDMSPRIMGSAAVAIRTDSPTSTTVTSTTTPTENNAIDSSASTLETSLSNGDINMIESSSDESSTINCIATTAMYTVRIQQDGSLKCYTRQMYNIPEDVIVFCNFSQLYKISASTFNMWLTILKKVPKSVLWLLRFPDDGENNLRQYTATQGVDESRVIFSDLESKEDHMRRIQLADIFLDTPLCNGHTTCLDAIWAGIPIVTMSGATFQSRIAASLLTAIGCIDMIATEEKDYIQKALRLGMDKEYLDAVKSLIWEIKSHSELFDYESYIKELECVFTNMWENFSTDN